MGVNGRKTSRPTGQLRRHREKLRQEAEVRQVSRELRSTDEQLHLLDSRSGSSKRERIRLERELV